MRTDNINISIKMPIPIDEPDRNGIIYSKESVIDAFKDVKGKPIVTYGKNGEEVILGYISDGYYSNGVLNADGVVWNGGATCCVIEKHKEGDTTVIDKFSLKEVGIFK